MEGDPHCASKCLRVVANTGVSERGKGCRRIKNEQEKKRTGLTKNLAAKGPGKNGKKNQ